MLEEVGLYFKNCVCGIPQDQQALPSLPSFTGSEVFFHTGETAEGFHQLNERVPQWSSLRLWTNWLIFL